MIRRSGDYKKDVRDKMRDGDGSVTIEHFWDAKEELKLTIVCSQSQIERPRGGDFI